MEGLADRLECVNSRADLTLASLHKAGFFVAIATVEPTAYRVSVYLRNLRIIT